MIELAALIHLIASEKGLITSDGLLTETVANYKNDVQVRIPDVIKADVILDWTAKIKVADSIRRCL